MSFLRNLSNELARKAAENLLIALRGAKDISSKSDFRCRHAFHELAAFASSEVCMTAVVL